MKTSLTAHFGVAAIFSSFLVCGASMVSAAQQSGSLADIARQARVQKQGQPGASSSQAQQIADELSENQNDKNIVGGFKSYDAGAYKLSVPAPYSTGAHDDGGVILAGPRVGSSTPLVLIGNPILLHSKDSDDAFHDASTQFAHDYSQSANCAKTSTGDHDALQCDMGGGNLGGHSVSGNAMFLRVADKVFPVFCVATTDSEARDIVNNQSLSARMKLSAQHTLVQEDEYVRQVWRKCDTVFQSIRFNAGAVAQDSSNVPQNSSKPVTIPDSVRGADTAQSTAVTKVQRFTYCKNKNECWDGSVTVPSGAQLISSECQQLIFEMKVQGTPFLLLAGPADSASCGVGKGSANPARWNQLAAPESKRAPGTYSTIGTQQTTIDGKPALITQMGVREGLKDWIGKRAELENNGVPLVVGCIALREHFPDGDDMCSGVIASLRLP